MATTNTLNTIDTGLMAEIEAAESVIQEPDSPVKKTELSYDEVLSHRYGANVWLASERHQPTGAYKIRGAYNFVRNLTAVERERGVVTASAGNHAQGIALSAARLGVGATIFMPERTPACKVDRVRELGGSAVTTVLTGRTFDDASQAARQYQHEAGAVFAHPFDDRRVIAGQGTLGLEITAGMPETDMLLCPIGGGGLISGVGTAVKAANPRSRIVGVEPAGAAAMRYAFARGEAVPLPDRLDTFVDGAAVQQVGQTTFAIARKVVEQVVVVPNDALRQTVTELWERPESLQAELAGALAVSGLAKVSDEIRGKTVVCIVSGGNLDNQRYAQEVRLKQRAVAA